jgi:AcrR family transcriptional regulator
MEAAVTPRPIDGDKAQRIVDAMRSSVARRGVAGSTFDHVARDAGVSRGLLHYYFGTKERLLAEVVRRDGELRMRMLEEQLGPCRDAESVIRAFVASLDRLVRDEPEGIAVRFELMTLARRNPEIDAELAAFSRRARAHVAGLLEDKAADGVLRLRGPAEAVAEILLAMADGMSMRRLTEADRDLADTTRAGVLAMRALLD